MKHAINLVQCRVKLRRIVEREHAIFKTVPLSYERDLLLAPTRKDGLHPMLSRVASDQLACVTVGSVNEKSVCDI